MSSSLFTVHFIEKESLLFSSFLFFSSNMMRSGPKIRLHALRLPTYRRILNPAKQKKIASGSVSSELIIRKHSTIMVQ